MTRKDAIEAIKCNWPDSRYTILREALDMAISALRHQDVTDKYVGKMTNAQKIRAMSDDELAEFLADAAADYCHVGLCKDGETCRICCLNWLQQPAEEDKHDERKENENVRR